MAFVGLLKDVLKNWTEKNIAIIDTNEANQETAVRSRAQGQGSHSRVAPRREDASTPSRRVETCRRARQILCQVVTSGVLLCLPLPTTLAGMRKPIRRDGDRKSKPVSDAHNRNKISASRERDNQWRGNRDPDLPQGRTLLRRAERSQSGLFDAEGCGLTDSVANQRSRLPMLIRACWRGSPDRSRRA